MQVKDHAAPVCGVAGFFSALWLESLKDLTSGQKSRCPESQGSNEEGRSRHSQCWPPVTFTRVGETKQDH